MVYTVDKAITPVILTIHVVTQKKVTLRNVTRYAMLNRLS